MQTQRAAARLNIDWHRRNCFGPWNYGMQLIRRSDENVHHEVATLIGKRLCREIPEGVEGAHYAAYRGLPISPHYDAINSALQEGVW